METNRQKITRICLGSILILVALNAFGGGYYGLAGAENVPLEWLKGSPFSSYFIPSLFLFTVVGGLCLVAGILVLAGKPLGNRIALLAGAVLVFWIVIQVAIIRYVSWLQPASFSAGIIVLFLAWRLQKAVW